VDDRNKVILDGINVLLVEDNMFNQMFLSKVLENWNCNVVIAGNGQIAVEKLVVSAIDVILMDIQMPVLDGYETANYIRTKIPAPKGHVPIIAMTAHVVTNEIEKCLSYGMNDYVSKPFEEDVLLKKILKVLGKTY
jgi:CheY-like chemotaxis protein